MSLHMIIIIIININIKRKCNSESETRNPIRQQRWTRKYEREDIMSPYNL